MSHACSNLLASRIELCIATQAEVRLPYVTCEFYLGMLSRLAPEPLWLGSVPGLRSPAALAEAAVSHVLLLCRAAPPAVAVMPGLTASVAAEAPLQTRAAGSQPASPARSPASGSELLALNSASSGAEALLLEALSDAGVRAAVRSCAAAGAACTLVPLPPPQVTLQQAVQAPPHHSCIH